MTPGSSLPAQRVRVREPISNGASLAGDLLAIFGAHALCYRSYADAWFGHDTTAAALAAISYSIIAHARGLHRNLKSQSIADAVRSVGACWAWVVFCLLAAGFLTKTLQAYSRVIILMWFALAPLAITLLRVVQHQTGVLTRPVRRVAIYGAGDLGAELVDNITAHPALALFLLGAYDDRHPARVELAERRSVAVRGGLEQLVREAREGRVDVIYIALPLRAEARINAVIRRLQDTTASVYLACDVGRISSEPAAWRQIGDVTVMPIAGGDAPIPEPVVKRFIDLIVSALLMAALALPMLAIAIAVKLGSRGPVFSRKRLFALNGQELRLLTFRVTSVEPPAERRVTRFGGWLRSTGLDELPQLIEVVLGRLSIVGPRPHTSAQRSEYRTLIEAEHFTRKVKPGIVCLAQVYGSRELGSSQSLKTRVAYDLAYAREWALGKDLAILLRSAHVFVRARRERPSRHFDA